MTQNSGGTNPQDNRFPILSSLGYLLAYAIPALPILSAWLGEVSARPNLFAFAPLAIAYGLVAFLQWLWPYPVPARFDAAAIPKRSPLYFRLLLFGGVPAQLAMLAVTTHYWCGSSLNGWGSLGYLLSTGVLSGIFAITLGHELIHRPQQFDRFLGGLLLSTVSFGTFKVVHLQIHHCHVGTPLDFATARRGQSLYSFWWQSLVGNFSGALRCERECLAKAGKSFWQSELLIWYGFSLLWLSLTVWLWGGKGGVFFILQSAIAILKLDWTNYIQHYGLMRTVDASGKYEPVGTHHAWSQALFIHDFALLNLFRHGEHHAAPNCPYPYLRSENRSPVYPYQHVAMFFLALIPPVFQRVVHPCLEQFEAQQEISP
ncbi:alkane 1-monooxygenase [Pseudanabaena sp. PCC 6802]|uniref:alkane 1-monooxygenase n=1 Tax=Pseudanabaena sp. PCC 6802 TaxID=118173 RepID=UPI00034B8026|nr:alkane 1-monooxygenase [Pseudanabaena sp. PCC 6802]